MSAAREVHMARRLPAVLAAVAGLVAALLVGVPVGARAAAAVGGSTLALAPAFGPSTTTTMARGSGFVVNAGWPMIGFSDARSGVNPYENVLSPADVSGLQEAWEYPVPGEENLYDPVAADGTVYAVNSDTDVLYAVNEANGALRWQRYLGAYGSIPSTAAVSGGVVYIGDGGGLHALSAATGAQRWVFPTYGWDSGAPIVSGGVYTGTNSGFEYAVAAATGKQIWHLSTDTGDFGTAALADGVLYVGNTSGPDPGAYALNARTGKEIWKQLRPGSLLSSTPTVGDGLVYFGPAYNGACFSSCYIFAVDARTGAIRWRFLPANMSTGGDFALSGNTLYATTGLGFVNNQPAVTSDLYALDATTGKEEWAAPVSGTPNQPAVANGVVYVGGLTNPAPHQYDGMVSALDATTGAMLWREIVKTCG